MLHYVSTLKWPKKATCVVMTTLIPVTFLPSVGGSRLSFQESLGVSVKIVLISKEQELSQCVRIHFI